VRMRRPQRLPAAINPPSPAKPWNALLLPPRREGNHGATDRVMSLSNSHSWATTSPEPTGSVDVATMHLLDEGPAAGSGSVRRGSGVLAIEGASVGGGRGAGAVHTVRVTVPAMTALVSVFPDLAARRKRPRGKQRSGFGERASTSAERPSVADPAGAAAMSSREKSSQHPRSHYEPSV
jgi:hypothetical protein